MTAISNSFAGRLRYERGLLLPIGKEYVDPRMSELAIKQNQLVAELYEIDGEILALATLDGYIPPKETGEDG